MSTVSSSMPSSMCIASWRQPALGVALGGRAVVGRAVVAVEVDERVAQAERLGHADQGVVDGLAAVRVELAHGVAGDLGALHVGAVGPVALDVHVVQDPAVDRLQPVAGVGQGPGDDDGHGVVEEGALHLLLDLDGLDRAEPGAGAVAVVGGRRSGGSDVSSDVEEPHVVGVGWMKCLRTSTSSPIRMRAHLVGDGGLLDSNLQQGALGGGPWWSRPARRSPSRPGP